MWTFEVETVVRARRVWWAYKRRLRRLVAYQKASPGVLVAPLFPIYKLSPAKPALMAIIVSGTSSKGPYPPAGNPHRGEGGGESTEDGLQRSRWRLLAGLRHISSSRTCRLANWVFQLQIATKAFFSRICLIDPFNNQSVIQG